MKMGKSEPPIDHALTYALISKVRPDGTKIAKTIGYDSLLEKCAELSAGQPAVNDIISPCNP